MDTPEEKAVCGHCKKDVAKANLSMHEAHCTRFLCLCIDCDELVPKESLAEHREEQHTVVRCKRCNMKMERYKLPDHETSECTERLETCEFCELDLPLSSLKEHTVACGSRTERCPDCNQYVTFKDQNHHAKICAYNLSKEDKYEYKEFMKPVPADNLQKMKRQDPGVDQSQDCDADELRPPEFSFSALHRKMGEAIWFEDVAEISTCPYCHLALPVETLKWHENKCKIFECLKQMN